MSGLCSLLHHLLPVTEGRVAGATDHPGTEADGVPGVEVLLDSVEDCRPYGAQVLVSKT